MAGHSDSSFIGAGGVRLYSQTWAAESAPRGVIAIVHGAGEHSGRYPTIVEHLTASGFAIAGFDHRGHGQSPGRRGHIMSWSEYREDVRAFLGHVGAQFPDVPMFLYGHSLGGLIATEYVLFHPEGLDGLIVSGIATRPTGVRKRHLVIAARLLSRFLPTFSVRLQVDPLALSRDESVVRAYNADPLVHHMASMRWGTEIFGAIARVRSRTSEISLPILILHGGGDRVTGVEGSQELFEKVSSSDKKLIVYPESGHEPHNDFDRVQVAKDVETWLEAHLTEDVVSKPRAV